MCTIARIFNIILKFGYVPNGFGIGVIVPIPKGKQNCINNIDGYRGITMCNVLSKVFEHCVLILCKNYLSTSDRQFAFKKGVSCQHAIYTLNRTVNHFTSRNSTVNLCSLDLTKAFDRISHNVLIAKLIKRKLPLIIILTIFEWYSKLFSVIKWGNNTSDKFQM